MSQLPQPMPSGRFRRSLGFDLGQRQETQLDVSPRAVTGPDYSSSQQLSGLANAAGQMTNAIGQFAANANAERDRANALSERRAREASAATDKIIEQQAESDKNAAALRSAELLPQLIDQMRTGKLAPLPEQKIEDFAHQAVAAYAGTESPEYASEMTRLLVPRLIGEQVELAGKGRAIAQKAEDDGVVSRVTLSTDWIQSLAALEGAKKQPGMTPDRLSSIALRSMMIAAESGNAEVVDSMSAWLGTAAPEAKQKAKYDLLQVEAALARAEAAKQAQVVNDFQNTMSRLFIDHAPISQKRAALDSWAGVVPDEVRRGFSASIDAEAEQVLSKFEKQAKDIAKSQAQQDIYTVAAAAMQSGKFATLLDDDFRRTLPDGTEVSESPTQVQNRVMEAQLQVIDDQLANQPESVRNKAGISYAAPNDIIPERFVGTLTAGLGSAQTWMQASDTQPIPQETVRGLALARDLKTTAPNLYGKLDQRLRSFYDLAIAAQHLPQVGSGTPESDQAALSLTMQSIRNGTAGRSIDNATVRFTNPYSNAKNAGAIESLLAERASTYTRLPGMSDRSAVQAARASLDGFKKSNGYAIDLSAATVPGYIAQDFDKVTQAALDEWWKRNKDFGEKQGYDRDGMFIMPTHDGLFMLYHDNGGFMIPVVRENVMTTSSLDKLWHSVSPKSPENIQKETVQIQERTKVLRKEPFTFGLTGGNGFTTMGAP